jgi:hypothetical protein
MDDCALEEECEAFGRDYWELEYWRERSLGEVMEELDSQTSYKFTLLGPNALIAVDGTGPRKHLLLARVPARRPRVVSVRGPP